MPKVAFFTDHGDSLKPLQSMSRGKETLVKVELQGGMERVRHQLFLTSKNAKVVKNDEGINLFTVTPLNDEWVELIVDVKTQEDYFYVRNDGKKKEIIKTYPPKTYMVGYEKVQVK
ncbi:MAG: hypothetical protein ACK40G_11480 [Cytophagaceae bacterium]